MPLRCIDPGKGAIHAFDLTPHEWRALRIENKSRRHLLTTCCGAQIALKRSSLGTQFFAHKARGACTTAPETEIHLQLKRLVVELARANGWDAEAEVAGSTPSGEQWKADVLAQKGTAKVAFEIQWSAQTYEETARRQERYAQSGVRCLWLMRRCIFTPTKELPAVVISETPGEELLVEIKGERQIIPAREFLSACFNKRFRFGVPLGVEAAVSVWAGTLDCWNCGAETNIISGVEVSFGGHTRRLSVPEFDEFTDLFGEVRKRITPAFGIATIKPRFSRTQKRSYLSNGCFHCDALMGQFFEHDVWSDEKIVSKFPIVISDRWKQIFTKDDWHFGWSVY